MALKKYKPITAGTRWRIGNAFAEITTDAPERSLLEKVKSTGGRNAQGRRSMRYIGGGHKKMFRIIDFKRDKKHSRNSCLYRIRSKPYCIYRIDKLQRR
jgi:large subunit ribosomal protein L2